MKAYLIYWTPEGCHESSFLLHAASEQYHKLRSGDLLYFITRREVFEFIGRILVDRIVGQVEAASYLRVTPEKLWSASYHALAARETATPTISIPCEQLLSQIYVISGGRPTRIKEPFIPQRFQAIREISLGSGRLFDNISPGAIFSMTVMPNQALQRTLRARNVSSASAGILPPAVSLSLRSLAELRPEDLPTGILIATPTSPR